MINIKQLDHVTNIKIIKTYLLENTKACDFADHPLAVEDFGSLEVLDIFADIDTAAVALEDLEVDSIAADLELDQGLAAAQFDKVQGFDLMWGMVIVRVLC
jgi:hypothetical protein